MFQTPDFCQSNSIPLIFYGSNHFDIYIYLIANKTIVAQNCHYGFFEKQKKKLKFLFLVMVICTILLSTQTRNDEEPV